MKWVKIEKYYELTGETEHGFHGKKRKGLYAEGRHYKMIERRIWINLQEMEKWADSYRVA